MVSLWLLACGFLFVDINEAVVYGGDSYINEKNYQKKLWLLY